MYSTKNKVSPSSPAFLGLRRNAQVSGSREGSLIILSKEGFAKPQGFACWGCSTPFLIDNLTTPEHGIKTAEVDN